MSNRVFTGLKPTGQLTLGNYLGAIRPLTQLATAADNDLLVMVADLHALTVDHNPARVRELTVELAATLLACGLEDQATLFVQSSVSGHTELSYLLECVASYGEMQRMIQFKEKASKKDRSRLSLLTYPALMAADILAYQADIVPVGEDQKQHLELTITLANRFNSQYGQVFTVPQMVAPVAGARIKDLRDPSAKMGKSNADTAGVVYLLDTPDVIAAKIRRAVTDADPVLSYDPVNRPGVANLAVILGELTGTTPAKALEGLHGGGALKNAVTDAVLETLAPVANRYAKLHSDQEELLRLLRKGADQIRPDADQTVSKAKQAMGLLAV